MKKILLSSFFILNILNATESQAADIQIGKEKAKLCFACHGVNGKTTIPAYPNLSGQSALYLANALKGYKNGQRTDAIMVPMAKILSEQDIANISAYFASLR